MLADADAVFALAEPSKAVGANAVIFLVTLEVSRKTARSRAVIDLADITAEVAAGKGMEAFRLIVAAL